MERYSTLWGTAQSGPYGRLGSSQRLGNFLMQKIGAANIKDVVELTEKIVTGIVMLPGYEKETLANKPLAVVYAPLYLEKKPGMPSGMKAFCALGVSGLEHREIRESSYSHTWFFPREDMLAGGEYNYLDLVMGTPLTTNRDVALHRDGSLPLNFERMPQKVVPALTKKDAAYVVAAIEALYQKKNVVLILEAGANFNSRAMQLLTELYSVMQPVMATETGFATYQTQKRILELSADTNVQIYVAPAGMDLSELPASKFQIMDLAKPIQLERTPVAEALNMWMKLDWQRRSRAMMHLFANSSDYFDAEQFVKLTNDFVWQYQNLDKWRKDTSKNKTVTSMDQLQAEDKTATDWKLVPWAKEVFEKKIPELLKDSSLEILNARNVAAFYEYNGSDKELKDRSGSATDAAAVNRARQQYKYGRALANVNEAELCRLIWEKADQRVGVGYREQLANQQAQYKQNVADMQRSHEQALQTKNDELSTQARVFEQKESEFKRAWNEQKRVHQQELDRQQNAHESALSAAVAVEVAKTVAVQAKLDAADQVHADEVERLNQLHQTNMKQQKQEAENAMTQLRQQADIKVRELETQKQSLENDLLQSNAERKNLQDELIQSNTEKDNLQKTLVKAKGDMETLQNDLNRAQNDKRTLKENLEEKEKTIKSQQDALKNADKQIDGLTRQYQQATGQEPKPHVPTVRIGPFELPKAVISLMAISAVIFLLLGAVIGYVIGGLPSKYELHWSINGQVDDSSGNMGIVSLKNDTAEAGEIVTIDVAPADGWQLESIKCKSGTMVGKVSDTAYTFVMPKQEEEIQVSFTQIPIEPVFYELHWSINGQIDENSGAMGAVELDHSTAEAGEMINVTVIPADGWELAEVKCENGTEVTQVNDTEYAIVMPEHEECIQVTFHENERVYIDESGMIKWEMVQQDNHWISTAVTDLAVMEECLGKDTLSDQNWVTEAILLPENWEATENEQLSPYILQMRGAEETADARELLEKEMLVLDNGEHILLIPVPAAEVASADWNAAMRAARDIMNLLGGTDDRLECFSYMLEDGRIVDLQTMMDEAGMPENWWLDLDRISLRSEDKENAQYKLKTKREVSLVLLMADDTIGAVLNYADKQDKAEEMVRLAEDGGFPNCHVGDFVLVVMN